MSVWPKQLQCAVSLTYDDAMGMHHAEVAPLLNRYGMNATFNIPCARGFFDSVDLWRKVAAAGHELGNHTLFHPCWRLEEDMPQWLSPCYNLRDYSQQRFADEVHLANQLLTLVDGREEHTFANPCHNTMIGSGESAVSFERILPSYVVAARGELTEKPADPHSCSLYNIGTLTGDRKTFFEIRDEIEAAAESGGWLVYTIHRVEKGNRKNKMDSDEHCTLIEWLYEHRDRVWTAPMIDIARYVQAARGR